MTTVRKRRHRLRSLAGVAQERSEGRLVQLADATEAHAAFSAVGYAELRCVALGEVLAVRVSGHVQGDRVLPRCERDDVRIALAPARVLVVVRAVTDPQAG